MMIKPDRVLKLDTHHQIGYFTRGDIEEARSAAYLARSLRIPFDQEPILPEFFVMSPGRTQLKHLLMAEWAPDLFPRFELLPILNRDPPELLDVKVHPDDRRVFLEGFLDDPQLVPACGVSIDNTAIPPA